MNTRQFVLIMATVWLVIGLWFYAAAVAHAEDWQANPICGIPEGSHLGADIPSSNPYWSALYACSDLCNAANNGTCYHYATATESSTDPAMGIWVSHYGNNGGAFDCHFQTDVGTPDCIVPYIPDSDGDGLEDDVDPFPQDDSPFIWRTVSVHYDENGAIDYELIEFKNDNGETAFKRYGELPTDEYPYAIIGPQWRVQSDYVDAYGTTIPDADGTDDEITSAFPITEVRVRGDHADPAADTGQTVTGSETDTELRQKIVTNTQETTSNLKSISDQIGETNERLKNIEELERAKLEKNIEIQEEQPEDIYTDDPSYANELNALNASGALDGVDTDILPSEIPEVESLQDQSWYDPLIDNNPLIGMVTGTTVQVDNPVCSFDANVAGSTLTFSMCEQQTILAMMGNIFMAICTMAAFITVAKS
jgi:hypothetical protein